MDDQTSWEKQLLVGAAVLVAVALLVGGIVAVVALKAADVAGLTSEPGNNSPTGPSAMSENLPESASATTTSAPPTSQPPTSSPTTSPPAKDDRKKDRKKKRRNRIELQISPPSAGTYERVNLTGSYRAGEGATLQVQRLEAGSWVDFPTSATVSGGTFSTYIETGHTGPNKFRMLDTSTGRTSNVAVVEIS